MICKALLHCVVTRHEEVSVIALSNEVYQSHKKSILFEYKYIQSILTVKRPLYH